VSTNQPKPIPVGKLAVLIAGVAGVVGLAGFAPHAAAWVQEQVGSPGAHLPIVRALPAPPDDDALAIQINVPLQAPARSDCPVN
jgi:hypothetical protein